MKIKDWTRPTALFLGRFQPWHQGHRAIVDQIFYKNDLSTPTERRTNRASQLVIMVRSPSATDPHTFEEIKEMIINDINLAYPHAYEVMEVPNITNIFFGRSIGFEMERIYLSDDLEPVENTTTTRVEKQHFNKDFWAGRQ